MSPQVHIWVPNELHERAKELGINVSGSAQDGIKAAVAEAEGRTVLKCPDCGGTEWTALYTSEVKQPVERLVFGPDGAIEADYTQAAEIVQEGEEEEYRCNGCGQCIDARLPWLAADPAPAAD